MAMGRGRPAKSTAGVALPTRDGAAVGRCSVFVVESRIDPMRRSSAKQQSAWHAAAQSSRTAGSLRCGARQTRLGESAVLWLVVGWRRWRWCSGRSALPQPQVSEFNMK